MSIYNDVMTHLYPCSPFGSDVGLTTTYECKNCDLFRLIPAIYNVVKLSPPDGRRIFSSVLKNYCSDVISDSSLSGDLLSLAGKVRHHCRYVKHDLESFPSMYKSVFRVYIQNFADSWGIKICNFKALSLYLKFHYNYNDIVKIKTQKMKKWPSIQRMQTASTRSI